MGAVWMLARAHMRPRWRSIVLLTVLVGFVGTAILASVAGARRSDSALPRFNAYSRSADAEITAGEATSAQLSAFERSPGVRQVAALRGFAISTPLGFLPLAGALDRRFGTVVDRPRVVDGRFANPAVADEVTIGEALATRLHLRVGGHLDVKSYTSEQVATAEQTGENPGDPAGPSFRLRVVGIVRRPLDLGLRGAAGGVIVLTPQFTRDNLGSIGAFAGTILRVRTQHGSADVPRVIAAARRIFGSSPVFDVQSLAIESEGARDAIDVLTVALWVFAGVAALAGLVAIGIMLSRDVSLTATDRATESALGLTRRQRAAASAMSAVPVAVGGGLLAVLGAVAASPLFPIGQARRADPDPGLHADWLVLGLGVAAVVGLALAIGALAALRVDAVAPAPTDGVQHRRASRTVGAVARAALPPSAAAGVRMATQPGRGRTAVPVRSAFLGAAFGVLGVVAALTFGASLTHLEATPHLYGWAWDFRVEDHAVPDQHPCGTPDDALAQVRGVGSLASVCVINTEVDGHPAIAWGFTQLRGGIGPTIVAGRVPNAIDEVALGSTTLDALGKHVGDEVRVQGPGGSARFQVVGRVVLPQFNDPQPLADGASFTGAGLARLQDPATGRIASTGYFVGRYRPGADRRAVTKQIRAVPFLGTVVRPVVPVEVERLTQIDQLPWILAGLLGLLATAAVGHALVTSVRRRRRDLAVLKTLGFERVQVRATVAWQATTLALVGLVVGIPLGVVVGKLIWGAVADNLGVSRGASVPVVAALVSLPAALFLANVIAATPAGAAARTRPAVVLRSE